MEQLASNLIGNAVQHGDPKSPLRVAIVGHAAHVEITVHNLGPTISAADARAIFDPLFRSKRSGPVDRSGSIGLGLYIAKQIAAAHGGDVTLRSSDERGTDFAVVLPVCSRNVVERASPPPGDRRWVRAVEESEHARGRAEAIGPAAVFPRPLSDRRAGGQRFELAALERVAVIRADVV